MDELPLAAVNDTELIYIISSDGLSTPNDTNCYFHTLNTDPLFVLENKYNNVLDEDNFHAQIRQLNIPKTEYLFLDSFSFIDNSDVFTNIAFNMRSIPTNL